jgi:hypothetical protein
VSDREILFPFLLPFMYYGVATDLTGFFRQPILLNSMTVQSGLVGALCRVAAGAGAALLLESNTSHVQAPSAAEFPEVESDALLHAALALAYLAYEDRSTAIVVASSIFEHTCAASVARAIMSGFARFLPLPSSRSSPHKLSSPASATSFAAHSTQLISLVALLICHDPGLRSSGAEHLHVLFGDSARSALQLFAGSWPFLQGEGRRWAAVAACALLPLFCSQSHQTSNSAVVSSSIVSQHDSALPPKFNRCAYSQVSAGISPVAPSIPRPYRSTSYSSSPRIISNVPAGSSASPVAASSAAASWHSKPPEPAVLNEATGSCDSCDMMSALYTRQYARFHPHLTFALRLQVYPSSLPPLFFTSDVCYLSF